MYTTNEITGPGYIRCRVHLLEGEDSSDERLYKTCTNWYTPVLGGIIKPYDKNIFDVTVYTN